MRVVSAPLLRSLGCLILFLLTSTSIFAQTKKGFKSLQKGKYEAASLAFVRDTANADLRPAAYFGLAQAWADEKNPAKNYRLAMQYQEQARLAWKVQKAAQHSALTKQFKVTFGGIEQLRRTAATNAWKAAEKSSSLHEIDEFLAVFPKNASYIERKALKKQSDLVAAGATATTGYDELAYLYNYHGNYLRTQLPGEVQPLENRLFTVFLAEKGLGALDGFYRDNPLHPLTNDAARAEFPVAWQSTTLAPLLDFMADHPNSSFAPYIRQKAAGLLKTTPLPPGAREALPEEQRVALGEIEWEALGQSIDPSGRFSPEQQTGWMLYVRKTAPGHSALLAVEKMYAYHVGQRNWDAAATVLRETKALFPSQVAWFDDRLSIVAGPLYGIAPVSAGPMINTTGSEYVPVLSADGRHLYFGGDGRADNEAGEDVFVSERSDTGWTTPRLVKELSGPGHQAPLSLSADGNRILLFNRAKPYQSDRTATGWTTPQPLTLDVSAFSWVGSVQIAANGQVMFLEARVGDDRVNTNLYVARLGADGRWGKPVGLAELNTGGDDRSPFLHPDLRTLYFSSDQHGGLGDLDVFKTTRLDETWLHWSRPVNLGKEINTAGQDWSYAISTDGTTAWFSTDTKDNGLDIFYVTLPDSMRPQQVKVVPLLFRDENGQVLREGRIVLKDASNGEIMGNYRVNPDGGATNVTVPNDRQYLVVYEQKDRYPVSVPLRQETMSKGGIATTEVTVPKLVAGVTQTLNIFFDYDQAVLKPESTAELQQIAVLAQQEGYRVKLLGYTDNAGNPQYNLSLSQRRAEAARQAIIGMGLPAERIQAEGFGENKPLVPNDTEAHRAQNRRVMVQLLKN